MLMMVTARRIKATISLLRVVKMASSSSQARVTTTYTVVMFKVGSMLKAIMMV